VPLSSIRALRAAFICSKPAAVFSSTPPNGRTSRPVNRSSWRNLLRPSPSGSTRNECSPSKSPGTSSRPRQRSSRSGSASTTVGLNVIARPPGGAIRTSSFDPGRASPLILFMNGFQSG
jgi:hypothetical protein